jgi:heat shock protein HslJ
LSTFITWDQADQITASTIRVSHIGSDTNDYDVLLSIIKGNDYVIIQSKTNSNKYQKFSVTGTPTIVPNSYIEIPVSNDSFGTSPTNFSNGDPILLIIQSVGLTGDPALLLAGGAMDTGAIITLDIAPDGNGFSTDSEVAGWGFGVQQKENGVNTDVAAYVDIYGFHADDSTTSTSTDLSSIGLTFDNGSSVSKGTTDAGLGGSKGVALKCSLSYELKWDAGRLYTMEPDGFEIRRVDHCGTTTPTATDDSTKGFVVGSIWTLDDGSSYKCTSAAANNATWIDHFTFTIGDGLIFNPTTDTLSCNTNIARRAGNQTFTGDNTFSGQVELTGQALTNGTSAVTRALGDARYGATYVGIKEENVESTNNTPIKLTSVTLPIGMYQIDCCIAATAATANGGYVFGLRANNPIRTTLFELYGAESLGTANGVVANDSITISQRVVTSTTSLTHKRQLMGLLEVVTNNTEVSIEFCQNVTTPAVPNTTRKRSYIIARKIA